MFPTICLGQALVRAKRRISERDSRAYRMTVSPGITAGTALKGLDSAFGRQGTARGLLAPSRVLLSEAG